MKYGLGVDIGGTKIATAIIDQDSNIMERVELPSISNDKEEMFKQVVNSIENVLVNFKLDITQIIGMGIGVPGKLDRKNGIAIYQNNLPWENFPIIERLNNYFSINNITIDNDVYMAALAEWKNSNVTKKDTFVYVTVSTGISCAIIHQGSFMRGAGFAGEVGLLPVLSNASSNGIHTLEDTTSGPAIQRIARNRLNYPNMTTEQFFLEYQNGNRLTESTMKEVVQYLTQGIYSIVCLLDPHQIIFGGGVMNNHPYLLDLVKRQLEKYLIEEQKHTLNQMGVSVLSNDSGVVGAGLRGIDYLNQKWLV